MVSFNRVHHQRLMSRLALRVADKGLLGLIGQMLKAKVVMPGSDVTLISYSSMMFACYSAAAELAEAGISAEVIDLRTISPWDKDAVLASVEKTGRAVVVHEAVRNFGPGAEIAATIQEELFGKLKAPVRRLGAPYCAVPFAKVLEDAFLVQPAEVVACVKALMA